MFFQQSLRELRKEREENLTDSLLERLQKGGIELSWLDWLLGERSIFVWLPKGELWSVLVHEAILNDSTFHRQGAPYYHFTPCEEIKRVAGDIELSRRYLASLPSENRFDFKTISGRSELRFFRDKPLEPCPLCLEAYRGGRGGQKPLDFNEVHGKSLRKFYGKEREREWNRLASELIKIRHHTCDICQKSHPKESLHIHWREDGRVEIVCKNCERRI